MSVHNFFLSRMDSYKNQNVPEKKSPCSLRRITSIFSLGFVHENSIPDINFSPERTENESYDEVDYTYDENQCYYDDSIPHSEGEIDYPDTPEIYLDE